jgi:DNA-binding MarR family transcriptional regulator
MFMKNDNIDGFNVEYIDMLQGLLKMQEKSDVQVVRKEGEVLVLIKQEPRQPVKYYMNKSGMSPRWFNEILKQLLASKLVVQETCKNDSRRKLLS